MRLTTRIMIVAALCLPSVVLANDADRRAQQNLFGLTPLYTLNARNVQGPVVNISHAEFNNVRLDEAEHFDGYTQSVELIIPFGEENRWEVRLDVPFNTRGSARTLAGAQSIDIRGHGGVFDFASLLVQRELGTTQDGAINSSVYFGYGHRTRELDTTIRDKYNHRGQVVRLGYNIDNATADNPLRLQFTADGRYYFDTDDLNPSTSSNAFPLMNLSAAVVYNAAAAVKPVLEIVYSTDFEDRQIIQAVPELIIPVTDWLELKGGYAFGHSGGEGSVQTATFRTTFSF